MSQPTPQHKNTSATTDRFAGTRRRILSLMTLAVAGLIWTGCSTSNEPAPSENELAAEESAVLDHAHNELVLLDTPQAVNQVFEQGVANFRQETPFRQVGFFYRADPDETLEWRVKFTDGKWSDWTPAEVTWREDDLHVGRAILEHEALDLELRGAKGLTWAQMEFYEEVVARPGLLARDMPFAQPADDFADLTPPAGSERVNADGFVTTQQKVAPRSLVIPRSEWGARNPGKVCGSAHNPYRMAIHHTVSPATDGGNAAAAMRGMQAFHIDSRGWCDIGCHFVVSQAGNIYQGRSSEKRLGAHVGNDNTGNIGICLIGNFQPGYSATSRPSTTQLKAAGRIVGWVHNTYNIALNRTSVKGHREHAGQTTSCPGDHLLNKIPTILDYAGGAADVEYDITVAVKWKGTENFYTQGISHNIADALPGDTFQAEIIIKNKSDDVIRNVWAGYQIEEPYIKATSYKIYTDHPAKDGSTWVINDADGADGNPARDNLGETGKINLFAFSAGESKRILVDLKATQYSIGAADHPDVRGWIQHAEGRDGTIYGDQNSWGDAPATNKLGHKARGYAQIDVLERDVWRFNDTSDAANLEGWTGAPEEHVAALKNNISHGLLSLQVGGDDARLIAPAWAEINADQYDQLVLRMRSHAGPHTTAVFWGSAEQSFSADRSVKFEAPGDTEFNDLVIPLGTHADWKGTVKKLRIDPLDEAAPRPEDSAWYDIDEIFFQSSTDKSTSAPGVEYVDAAPVSLGAGSDPGEEPSNPEQPDPDPGNTPEPGDEQPEPDPDTNELNPDEPRTVVNSGGCSVSSGADLPSPGGIAWILVAGGVGLLARRR